MIDTNDLMNELENSEKLYNDAGLDGEFGATLMRNAKDEITRLKAEFDAANDKLAKAIEIAELFLGGVEYDYHGNIVGEEERKALAELEELAGCKEE